MKFSHQHQVLLAPPQTRARSKEIRAGGGGGERGEEGPKGGSLPLSELSVATELWGRCECGADIHGAYTNVINVLHVLARECGLRIMVGWRTMSNYDMIWGALVSLP